MITRLLLSLLVFTLGTTIVNARKASEVQPLLIGAKIPSVSVTSESGEAVELRSLTKGKHTALVFYRGGWCPYCNRHLQALGQAEAELLELGYQIIAISPDSAENLRSAEKDSDLNYSLFSDAGLEAASAFGIDFEIDKGTLLKYKTFGIDLEKSSGGANKNRLPVPAIFLITPSNEISFQHVDPDYRYRLSTRLLLAAAKDGKEFHTKK